MAAVTEIGWTDMTVNFWQGCAKVSEACRNCYAESMDARFHGANGTGHWGPTAPRLIRVPAARAEAMRYERRAIKEGVSFKVFTNSMADIFEDRRDLDDARLAALDTMRETPHLTWLLLTKRPEKVVELLNRAYHAATGPLMIWLERWIYEGKAPANIWIGTTVENQEWADRRIPWLIQIPAVVRVLSAEPLLGPVNLTRIQDGTHIYNPLSGGGCDEVTFAPRPAPGLIHWVIAGGESGAKARSMSLEWPRSLREQCVMAGVAYFYKQHGEFGFDESEAPVRLGKKAAGCELDGMESKEFPVPAMLV